jgi:hypothetical protein
MRRALVTLWLCACGARSEITGMGVPLDGSSFDATTSDVGVQGDGAPFGGKDGGGGGDSFDACADVTVGIGCAGPNKGDCDKYGCKFQVEWTCIGGERRIGGSCGYGDAGAEYQGVCVEDGKTTSTFDVPAATCDCTDASALITVVEEKCQHQ